MTSDPQVRTTPKTSNPSPSRFQSVRDIRIGRKLTIGFGLLVMMTLIVVFINYRSSLQASQEIETTVDTVFPIASVSSEAQTNLLRMLAAARGYLALGDPEFKDQYYLAEDAFRANLSELQTKRDEMTQVDQIRLDQLVADFAQWEPLPQQLFDLRDDRLKREPAYFILMTDGIQSAGLVLIDLQKMIDAQALREPTQENIELLKDMANYQGSFAAMLSGLRNYVTTQNRIFRSEYYTNLDSNQFAWETLLRKDERGLLTPLQQQLIENIQRNRTDFVRLPEEQIFPILESDRAREDLYLFATEAIPLNENMLQQLDAMTSSQQRTLEQGLTKGRVLLNHTVQQTIIFGAIAAIAGILLSVGFRAIIAGPIIRVTNVAEQIGAGDLEAQAQVESGDEIGVLARTFNNMTGRLRDTLFQVRKEKKRADDLLGVVIPIGVELSSEKDFNRLLEKMLVEAKSFCHANTGIVYLQVNQELRPTIVRNDALDVTMGGVSGQSLTYPPIKLVTADGQPVQGNIAVKAARENVTFNLTNVHETEYGRSMSRSPEIGYIPHSCLAIPLSDSNKQVSGVLQLLDPRDPDTKEITAFDDNLQQMMESFSSLAAAALEAYMREQVLRQEIQKLRIEIDEVKQQKQVEEITGTDFFKDLQAKASQMRNRKQNRAQQREDDEAEKQANADNQAGDD